MEKCVVTGGAGFIGSHLVDYLLKKGHEVNVVDTMVTGNVENIQHHLSDKNFELYPVDVSNFLKRKQLVNEVFNDADWVFHLAALADIVPSIENPIRYHKYNVDGTVNILECAREVGISRFVYMASSTCYGIAKQTPTPESAPIQPMYPYALTKYLGEQCVMHWGKLYRLPINSIRCFNVYGTRSRTSGAYGAVFGVFLAQKLASKPFTVIGNGEQRRDFTYVSDVIKALYDTAKSDFTNEIINIGSGETHTVNEIVELLGGQRILIPKRPGEPDITFADITRAEDLLNYKPRVTFKEGVQKLLDNIDYWKDSPVWTPKTISTASSLWFKYLGGK